MYSITLLNIDSCNKLEYFTIQKGIHSHQLKLCRALTLFPHVVWLLFKFYTEVSASLTPWFVSRSKEYTIFLLPICIVLYYKSGSVIRYHGKRYHQSLKETSGSYYLLEITGNSVCVCVSWECIDFILIIARWLIDMILKHRTNFVRTQKNTKTAFTKVYIKYLGNIIFFTLTFSGWHTDWPQIDITISWLSLTN